MAKLSLNILPTLKTWFVEKTNIVKEWSASVSDDNIPSEKLVKTEIDNANSKHTSELAEAKTELETEIATKVPKSAIKSTISESLTDEELIGGQTLYTELKRLEEDIPDNIKHTDITDWDTATSDFQLISNLETTVSNNSSNENAPSAKAVYDLYATIPKWQVTVANSVSDLPATGQLGTIYLVKGTGKDKNNYDEYFWNDKAETPGYEKFGGIDIDLSSFVTMSDVVSYISNNGSLALSDDGELSLTITDPVTA